MEDTPEAALTWAIQKSKLGQVEGAQRGSLALRKEMAVALRSVPRLGTKKIDALIEAGFERLEDLAFHYPGRYLDARQLVPLKELRKYLMKPVSVRGRVLASSVIPGRHRARAAIALQDDSGGVLQLVFFDYPEWRAKMFQKGQQYLVAGYVGMFNSTLQIVQPPFVEHLEHPEEFIEGQMLPLYYLSSALRKSGFRDKQFREIIHTAVQYCESQGHFKEILPREILERENLIGRPDAIIEVHHPQSPDRLEDARRRLKYEEVFFLQLRLAVERRRVRSAAKSVLKIDVSRLLSALDGQQVIDPGPAEQLLVTLPYQLTGDQKQSLRDILNDMSKSGGRNYPMNRLLQGDVGSGKTIVALLAMLAAIEQGYQCAFMAPTEVLAQQHYATLTNLLKDTSIECVLLVGGQGAKLRKSTLNAIVSGQAHIAIGTHALIEKGVRFEHLGFIVTDEQHRFGVAQRKALIEKAFHDHNARVADESTVPSSLIPRTSSLPPVTPDVLIMSATPIPRTLALTLYGDMAVSTIREMPAGRKPIKTMLFFEHDHPKIYEAAKRRIRERNEQVFIVYPLREKSEKVDSEAAEKAYEVLRHGEFKDVRVGLVHGKMSGADKQDAMERFRDHAFDVLVATTVIEVGVDVPNATVMIIEHAERFGLAQLHQLRGRVGRGSADSACVLVASEKLSPDQHEGSMETSEQLEQSSLALERLNTLVRTSDGFEIAKADLAIRGTGEILGVKQSGKVMLKMANLTTDIAIVEQTLRDADALVHEDPELREVGHAATRNEFLRLYRDAESYLHVG
ncbi:MAG: ATP-dependent DNA helicase RecG [Bacteroidota bacterium]|nr:ATP-dependent DNA helicase RecG [Bacteroidota bacterium]MDP4232052.1 ATP-dependent DNA helicase RecG [Bacteroidota bacterium]MDP4241241.1 ATP-dependent DNA helicase RecG [Bacteroidota bacterium]MDP4286633.1 ATP-dependent DNA helicase RecG [Bacteroidota bacterium]